MADEKTAKAVAKAAQETAKTGSKAIDAAREFGTFISGFIAGPLEQATGIVEDHLRYIRWERQQRLMDRAIRFAKEQALPPPDKSIPLKNAIPLFLHATIEEDDYLQDMWARLLVNGTNEATGINLERSFIEILAQISHLEARILQTIYKLPFEKVQHKGIVTEGLPDVASIADDDPASKYNEPALDVKLALATLARIGCVRVQDSWGGGEIFSEINPTLMGKEFVRACTFKETG